MKDLKMKWWTLSKLPNQKLPLFKDPMLHLQSRPPAHRPWKAIELGGNLSKLGQFQERNIWKVLAEADSTGSCWGAKQHASLIPGAGYSQHRLLGILAACWLLIGTLETHVIYARSKAHRWDVGSTVVQHQAVSIAVHFIFIISYKTKEAQVPLSMIYLSNMQRHQCPVSELWGQSEKLQTRTHPNTSSTKRFSIYIDKSHILDHTSSSWTRNNMHALLHAVLHSTECIMSKPNALCSRVAWCSTW